jgi:hypothetical protein
MKLCPLCIGRDGSDLSLDFRAGYHRVLIVDKYF